MAWTEAPASGESRRSTVIPHAFRHRVSSRLYHERTRFIPFTEVGRPPPRPAMSATGERCHCGATRTCPDGPRGDEVNRLGERIGKGCPAIAYSTASSRILCVFGHATSNIASQSQRVRRAQLLPRQATARDYLAPRTYDGRAQSQDAQAPTSVNWFRCARNRLQ